MRTLPALTLPLALLAAPALSGCDPFAQPIGQVDEVDVEPDREDPDPLPPADVLDRLRAVELFEDVEEIGSDNAGYRAFDIFIRQSVRYQPAAEGGAPAPGSDTFLEHIVLLHKDDDAPLVVANIGYGLLGLQQYLEEPAALLSSNQVTLEHRFFGDSVPSPATWDDLTIENAAIDNHRVIEALREVYPQARVLETGASKGGMTSVFHARFFPDDVDGVIAYVAPISFALQDARFVDYVAAIGDPDCNAALEEVQRAAASHVDEMVDVMIDQGAAASPAELRNWAASLISTYRWGFWQFYTAADCNFGDVSSYSAQDLMFAFGIDPAYLEQPFDLQTAGYEYQAEYELGFPDQLAHTLDDALGSVDLLSAYRLGVPPWPQAPSYDDGVAMHDVADWVASEATDILFIYGENDPWSGGQFELGVDPQARGLDKRVAPGMNHGASITTLAIVDRAAALEQLAGFADVPLDQLATFSSSSMARRMALWQRAHEERMQTGRRISLLQGR